VKTLLPAGKVLANFHQGYCSGLGEDFSRHILQSLIRLLYPVLWMEVVKMQDLWMEGVVE
jgi:hypothetical protein